MDNKYISEFYIDGFSTSLNEVERIVVGDPERNEVKNFRRSKSYMWFYHGTRADDDIIRREGVKAQITTAVMIPGRPGGVNSDLFGKKFVWMTSIKTHAMLYTHKSGLAQIWKREKGKVLLVRVNSKDVACVLNYLPLGDEYIYPKDIPPKDILLPEDLKYKQVERKFKYLRDYPEDS